MTEKKCKNCGYWGGHIEEGDFSICLFGAVRGVPQNPNDFNSMRDEHPSFLIAPGFDDTKEYCWSGKDFGCIHFEEREVKGD